MRMIRWTAKHDLQGQRQILPQQPATASYVLLFTRSQNKIRQYLKAWRAVGMEMPHFFEHPEGIAVAFENAHQTSVAYGILIGKRLLKLPRIAAPMSHRRHGSDY